MLLYMDTTPQANNMINSRCKLCGDFILDDNGTTDKCKLCQLEEATKRIWYITTKNNKIFSYATSHEKAIENFGFLGNDIKELTTDAFIKKVKEDYRRKQ